MAGKNAIILRAVREVLRRQALLRQCGAGRKRSGGIFVHRKESPPVTGKLPQEAGDALVAALRDHEESKKTFSVY